MQKNLSIRFFKGVRKAGARGHLVFKIIKEIFNPKFVA